MLGARYVEYVHDEMIAELWAEAAASYRERGLTHDQVFAEVRERIRDFVLPFSSLRDGAKADLSFRRTYENAKMARLLIRKHHLNRILQSD
jgi:hypothetical protein